MLERRRLSGYHPLLVLAICAIGFVANVPSALGWQVQDSPIVSETIDPASYEVPTSQSVAELERFIDALLRIRPANGEQYLFHIQRMPAAIDEAARKIMALDNDPSSLAYRKAAYMTVVARVLAIDRLTDAETQTLIEEIESRLPIAEEFRRATGLASQAAQRLESSGKKALAIEAYRRFGNALSTDTDPAVATEGRRMIGAARRLELVGNPVEWFGNQIDGSAFDPGMVQGKFVLVDFWASWCGPCLASFPKLAKLREKYGTDRFDVIGVSLEKNGERVKDSMAKEGVVWPCLYETNVAWDHPMAVHYGITRIPSTILVGPDGKVIALDLRGKALEDKLAELLGSGDSAEVSDQR